MVTVVIVSCDFTECYNCVIIHNMACVRPHKLFR